MTDMTPGPVVEAATPGSGGAGVRESGEGSKTPVPPLVRYSSGCEDGAVHVCHFPNREIAQSECDLFDATLDCGPHHVVPRAVSS